MRSLHQGLLWSGRGNNQVPYFFCSSTTSLKRPTWLRIGASRIFGDYIVCAVANHKEALSEICVETATASIFISTLSLSSLQRCYHLQPLSLLVFAYVCISHFWCFFSYFFLVGVKCVVVCFNQSVFYSTVQNVFVWKTWKMCSRCSNLWNIQYMRHKTPFWLV